MKKAISISLGSSRRDKTVEIELLGQRISMERRGADGDAQKAAQWFRELDGHVDAFGLGGIDLSVGTPTHSYLLRAAVNLVKNVRQTPFVDGRGLKDTLERQAMRHVEAEIGAELQPKRAMVNVAMDRYGMAQGLEELGYEMVYGDLEFTLGIPLPLRRLKSLERVARVLAPLVCQLPFEMLYPTGKKQHERVPRFVKWFNWATVIAGDSLYTLRHMPDQLPGKTVLTNTTTEADTERFRNAGVRYLVTTTPCLSGRSFGTNMLEAALVAISGKGRPLTQAELLSMVRELGLRPEIRRLN